jgi:hypothetical protein
MNAIWSPGNVGGGVDSAFPEQLVIISKVSTVPSRRHLGFMEASFVALDVLPRQVGQPGDG